MASCSNAMPAATARASMTQVATIPSNCRWGLDVLELTCWNGEVVRVVFALDCHDREVISWAATTAGISDEMIRDMMVRCVEKRFDAICAPHPVQWLSDNGSIFAAYQTIESALALNLAPCFTPVESSESNGMPQAFVKTFKRDYVRINLIPNASAALALIDSWMEDYNTFHPHSRLGYRSPREYILSQSVACPAYRGQFQSAQMRMSWSDLQLDSHFGKWAPRGAFDAQGILL
jgi:putative transposase